MAIVASWQNAAGQTVVQHETGLAVLPRHMTVAAWQAAQASRERGRAAAQAAEVQVAEIERALPKDCVAVLNDVTGQVAVFSVPGGADEPDPGATLSPARRRTLELERDANLAIADDKASQEGARRMAAERAKAVQKLLALPDTPA